MILCINHMNKFCKVRRWFKRIDDMYKILTYIWKRLLTNFTIENVNLLVIKLCYAGDVDDARHIHKHLLSPKFYVAFLL